MNNWRPVFTPDTVDVAIVGSGITGLTAALHLIEAGRSVTVFDAREPGYGASTRNAGYVGRTLKHTFGEIVETAGLQQAIRVYRELMQAFLSVGEAVANWEIDCRFRQQGRFLMATSPAMYEAMLREFDLRRKHLGEVFLARQPRRAAPGDRYRSLSWWRADRGSRRAPSRTLPPRPSLKSKSRRRRRSRLHTCLGHRRNHGPLRGADTDWLHPGT